MPTTQLQEMGMAIEQDSTNWLRIGFGWFTSFYVSVNKILAGTQTQLSSTTPATGGATSVWSRLVRVGNVWTHSYSFDGKTYVQTVQFTQALTIVDVGVYSANQNGTPANAPAFTAIIDYFLGSKFTPPQVKQLQALKRASFF
jgi:regulation of enolase protein 1 (concanavalin A-like superfamily)